MKNILILFSLVFLIIACNHTDSNDKKFLTLSGKLKNATCDSITIHKLHDDNNKTSIKLQPDGSFKHTLNTSPGFYYVFMGKNFMTKLFFKNGNNIHINADSNNFDKTVQLSGIGIEESNFMLQYKIMTDSLREHDLQGFTKKNLNSKINNQFSRYENLLNTQDYDSAFMITKEYLKGYKASIKNKINDRLQAKIDLAKGKPSPVFFNYTNYSEGTTSLEDLKGSYVFIDLWATWCIPCIEEFPAMDKIINTYKNIKFVSINVNPKNHKKEWIDFMQEKKPKGIHLFATNEDFVKKYKLVTMPRYILIDPKGNIVDADTFRPSDPKLIELFESLDI